MFLRAATFASGIVLVAGTPVSARPLDLEACGKLRGELAAMDEKGVKALIDKGPAAAKDASKEQLRLVRQYFDVLGNFRFRCPQDAPLVVLKPEPVDDPAEVAAAATAPIEAGTPGITLPPGVAAATVGPIVPSAPRKPAVPKAAAAPKAATVPPAATPPAAAPPKKPAAAPKAAAPVAPTPPAPQAPQAPAAPAAAKPKPTPKAKADDAFRPAPATPAGAPTVPAAPGKTP